jgi:hypothetical protein
VAVEFPTSNPDGEVAAHVELDASLDDVPRWSLQTLNTGPARSSPAYGRHLEATIGSSYDWSDELRFDNHTGKLTSFVLKMPEAGHSSRRSHDHGSPYPDEPGSRCSITERTASTSICWTCDIARAQLRRGRVLLRNDDRIHPIRARRGARR